MESMMTLINHPEKAKIYNGTRILQSMLGEHISNIEALFKTIQNNMQHHIETAEKLKTVFDTDNAAIVKSTEDAVNNIAKMSQRLENTVNGLTDTINSPSWKDVENSTESFAGRVESLVQKIETATLSTTEKTTLLQGQIDGWIDSETKLFDAMEKHSDKTFANMDKTSQVSDTVKEKLESLSETVANGFASVKTNAADYETLLKKNTQVLNDQNKKIEDFTKKSKNLLAAQINTLKGTANAITADIRLSESTIEKQHMYVQETAEQLTSLTLNIDDSIRKLSDEFGLEIKKFATETINDLKSVSDVANNTLQNTATTAEKFSESVNAMAVGIREMTEVHDQLSSQSEKLMQVSENTTQSLNPLTELIEKHYTLLPEITKASENLHAELTVQINDIEAKMNLLKENVAKSIADFSESSHQLNNVSGESKQQMIDLLQDFKKATDTMQTLNKQLAVARATAPMEAIKKAVPTTGFPLVSSSDLIEHIKNQTDKLHDYSYDLIKALGAEIPDTVMAKYHSGDKSVFSKWLAKIFADTNAKKIRDFLKSNKIFKSQSIQYIYAFEKIVSVANKSDKPEVVIKQLADSDLGSVYKALKKQV